MHTLCHLSNCEELHSSNGNWQLYLELPEITKVDEKPGLGGLWRLFRAVNSHYIVSPDGWVHVRYGFNGPNLFNALTRS